MGLIWFALVCGSVYFQLLYKKRIAIFLAFILASSYGMLILLIRLGKKHSKWINYVLPGRCLLVSSVLSVIFVELISGNLFIETQYLGGFEYDAISEIRVRSTRKNTCNEYGGILRR